MKIYTKGGDRGTTGLFGGERVPKSSPRIASYGDIDELNALLGYVRSISPHVPVQQTLLQVQNVLFIVGAQLASPKANPKIEAVTAAHVEFLERQIDVISETLPPLTQFILPGGSQSAALLHVARTVCRRAERTMVELSEREPNTVDPWLLIYANRLSDFLFTLARLANQLERVDEVPWIAQRR